MFEKNTKQPDLLKYAFIVSMSYKTILPVLVSPRAVKMPPWSFTTTNYSDGIAAIEFLASLESAKDL